MLPLQPGSLSLNLNFLSFWTSASECGCLKKHGSQTLAHFLFPFSFLSWLHPRLEQTWEQVYRALFTMFKFCHSPTKLYSLLPTCLKRCPLAIAQAYMCKAAGSHAPRRIDPGKKARKILEAGFKQRSTSPWYSELGWGAQVPTSRTTWPHGLSTGSSAAEENQSQDL